VTLPFTRMLAGPLDFTPGGFRRASWATFKTQDSQPMVMGTRAAEVPLLAVFRLPLRAPHRDPLLRGADGGRLATGRDLNRQPHVLANRSDSVTPELVSAYISLLYFAANMTGVRVEELRLNLPCGRASAARHGMTGRGAPAQRSGGVGRLIRFRSPPGYGHSGPTDQAGSGP